MHKTFSKYENNVSPPKHQHRGNRLPRVIRDAQKNEKSLINGSRFSLAQKTLGAHAHASAQHNRFKRKNYGQKSQISAQANVPSSFCLVYIKRTKNNTLCSVSNLFGRQRTWWNIRGGQINPGGAKGRRKTRYSQRMIFKTAVEKLLGFGFKHLVIQVKGGTVSKRYIFKHFMKRFKIVMFKDLTGIAHNGCRPPKARRV